MQGLLKLLARLGSLQPPATAIPAPDRHLLPSPASAPGLPRHSRPLPAAAKPKAPTQEASNLPDEADDPAQMLASLRAIRSRARLRKKQRRREAKRAALDSQRSADLAQPCDELSPHSDTAGLAEHVGVSADAEKSAAKWRAHEDHLIRLAVEKYKNRCSKEAESRECSATISFEVLTREIPNFPKHVMKDSTYIVDSWGDADAAWWFYATHGTTQAWTAGTPILFAEVLESMMVKFLEQVKTLGFDSCQREPGTWKVTSQWSLPGQLNDE